MDKIFERFPEGTSSYIPLKLGYECGLRIGEIFALCWEDVDFNNKQIRINRQIQWLPDKTRATTDKILKNGSSECGNGYWYFSAPKYDSYRILEISDELTEILLREKDRQIRARDYYGVYYKNYDCEHYLYFSGEKPITIVAPANRIGSSGEGYPIHFVCIRENGSLITPRAMQHTSNVIKKEIIADFDFNSLRHTHSTLLAEVKTEPKYIQKRLGHKSIDVTVNVYEHLTDTMRSHGRQNLNQLYK